MMHSKSKNLLPSPRLNKIMFARAIHSSVQLQISPLSLSITLLLQLQFTLNYSASLRQLSAILSLSTSSLAEEQEITE